MKRLKINRTQHKRLIGVLVFVGVFVATLAFLLLTKNSFADEPVRDASADSVHTSYSSREQGAWQLTKKAKQNGAESVDLSYTVNSILKGNGHDKDVFVMIDASGSMTASRVSAVRSMISSLGNILQSDGDNHMSIDAFNTEIYPIMSLNADPGMAALNFSDHFPGVGGGTDYYKALKQLETRLANYTPQDGRDAIVLFITDGAPVEEHPLEVSEFQVLKQNYPFVTVQGIQFEMGDTIIPDVIAVSDNQFAADTNTLEDVIFEAINDGYKYDRFTMTAAIDTRYYEIESTSAKTGTVAISGGQITWNMDNAYRSGTKRILSVTLRTKEECINKIDGLCAVETSNTVVSSLNGIPDENVSLANLALKYRYDVIYDLNAPTGCDSSQAMPTTTKRLVGETIRIEATNPSCAGYHFIDMAISNDNVFRLNGDSFVMPEEDVVLRAIWARPSISKSMDGTVKAKTTATFAAARPNTSQSGSSRNGYTSAINAATNTTSRSFNTMVKHIVFSNAQPPVEANLSDATKVSASNSELPIWVYYDANTQTLTYYTDADVMILNADSRGLFAEMSVLEDITTNGLLDVSNVEKLDYLYYRNHIDNLDVVSDWEMPNLSSLYAAFYDTDGLTSADGLENWDVSKVTDMTGLFHTSSNLEDISALSGWQTTSLTNLTSAFRSCGKLADIEGIRGWDVSHVTSFDSLFYYDSASGPGLTTLEPVSGWNTGSVTTMENLVRGQPTLANLHGLEDWDVKKVERIPYAFISTNLQNFAELADWETDSLKTVTEAFKWNDELVSLDGLQNFNMSKVTSFADLFRNDGKLVDISALDGWKNTVSNVTTMSDMFLYCKKLTNTHGLENWQTSSLKSIAAMFSGAEKLGDISGLANWDTTKLESINSAFKDAKLTNLNALSNWFAAPSVLKTATNTFENNKPLTDIGGIANWDVSSATALTGLFRSDSGITSISALSGWLPKSLTAIGSAFTGLSITDVDALLGWGKYTGNLTDMTSMLYGCQYLENVDGLATWRTDKVTTLSSTFGNNPLLSDISGLAKTHYTDPDGDYDSWNTPALTNLYSTFSGDKLITDLSPLSQWNTNKVTTLSGTFDGVKATSLAPLANWCQDGILTNLSSTFNAMNIASLTGLESWNVSKVTTMASAFANNAALLDINAVAGWQVGALKNLESTFSKDSGITSVEALRNWNVESVTSIKATFRYMTGVMDFSPLDDWLTKNANIGSITNTYAFSDGAAGAILPSWY